MLSTFKHNILQKPEAKRLSLDELDISQRYSERMHVSNVRAHNLKMSFFWSRQLCTEVASTAAENYVQDLKQNALRLKPVTVYLRVLQFQELAVTQRSIKCLVLLSGFGLFVLFAYSH